MPAHRENKQQGFTLIEVVIAALVITLGLMGIVVLQVSNQAHAFKNHQRTLAGLYAQDLQARLRADICVLDKGINDQHSQWQTTHFVANRSNWASSLEVNSKAQAEENGYWAFNLIIKPTNIEKNNIQQTIIVKYVEVCDAI